jgi:thiamine-phosphate pyrophosphorylase
MVPEILQAGCRWLMVREKDLNTAELGDLAKDLVDLARPVGGKVVVNGDIAAAHFAGAAGVHLQNPAQVQQARAVLGTRALIGLSAHSLDDARAAEAAGADYVTLSPVFLTDSKPGYGPALGMSFLSDACRELTLPVIALAGIAPDNAGSCFDAGVSGVAVMGTVMRSGTPGAIVGALLEVCPALGRPPRNIQGESPP